MFRNERVDRTESSKSRAPVPPASGASEIAPGAPSAVAGEPSALHLPLPPPLPGSSSSCPFTGFQPQYARGFTLLSYYKVLYCKIKFFLYFLFSVFFVIFVWKALKIDYRTVLYSHGESHGGRSLVGYSPWGRKASDTTERLPFTSLYSQLGFSGGASGKEPTCNTGSAGDAGLIIGSGKIPCRKAWQPTAVFLRGESHE